MADSAPETTREAPEVFLEGHQARVYTVSINGRERRIGQSFYRGEVASYMPWRGDLDRPKGIADFILKGWMPEQPFIDQQTNVVAFGSCFAGNIGRYLAGMGFDVATQRKGTAHIQNVSDGLVNVFALCQQFEWAWEGRVPDVALWTGWEAEEYGYDESVRLATRKLFDEADTFVLTFGLSEVWYDEPTGEVFWRPMPKDKFDASRHKFRMATYGETIGRLRRIRDLIRTHRPGAKIIYTLSPVGLAATFRPVSCITANSVSKAMLRVAIDELYREVRPSDPDFYYFPSYEVVLDGFHFPFGEDRRHVANHVLLCNMKAFERYFCKTGLQDADLEAVTRDALAVDDLMAGATEAQRVELLRGEGETWRAATGPLKTAEREMRRQERILERQATVEASRKARAARKAKIKARRKRIAEKAAMAPAGSPREHNGK